MSRNNNPQGNNQYTKKSKQDSSSQHDISGDNSMRPSKNQSSDQSDSNDKW